MIQKLIPRILNMESDESLVQPNEFVDAVNVKIDGEEGVDFGTIKYADGNVKIDFYGSTTPSATTEVVTGFVEDESEDAVYVFCAGSNNVDSVYMISSTDAGYKMTLLARSAKFDLDKDKLTVGNIVRTYDKSITDTSEDDGTGFFGDGNTLTDFDPQGVIDYGDDEGEAGFADLVIIPNINQFGVLPFSDSASPSVPNHTIFVTNYGTNTGQVRIRYDVDVSNPGAPYASSVESINGVSTDVSVNGLVFDILPGQSAVFTLTHEVITGGDSFEDGWTWPAVIEITSPTAEFPPQVFEWTVQLNQESIGRGVPAYSPNPALDAGDFESVSMGQPSVQYKSYSITNNPGDSDETVDLTGFIYVQPIVDNIVTHNADYTYLQTIDPADGSLIIDLGDDFGSGLPFSIPVGETFDFDLVLNIPAGLTESYTDTVKVVIHWTDETSGLVAPISPTKVSSAPINYSVVEDVVVDVEDPPLIVAIATPGFEGAYAWDPISLISSDLYGQNYSNINYTVTNLGGAGSIDFNVEVLLDNTGIISSNLSSLLRCNFVNQSLDDSDGLLLGPAPSSWQVIVPEADPITPFSQDISFQLNYFAAGQGGPDDLSIQSLVNASGENAVATIKVTAVVATLGTTVIDTTLSLLIHAATATPELQYKIYHGSRFNAVGGTPYLPLVQEDPTGTGNLPFGVSCNYMTNGNNNFKDRNQIALEVFNSGNTESQLPIVSLSNTRVTHGGSLPGGFGANFSGSYLNNSNFNSEYISNDEFWIGYGCIEKANHPLLSGGGDFGANSAESNAIYSEGWSDLTPDLGWQANCYTQIDGDLAADGNRVYTKTPRNATADGWFTPQFGGSVVMHNVMPKTIVDDPNETSDTDNFNFEKRSLLGWQNSISSQAGPSAYTLYSPWIKPINGNVFNTVSNDAAPGEFDIIPTNYMIQPGESVYIIFNCNIHNPPASQVDNYLAILDIAAPPGSLAAQYGIKWQYRLTGTVNANTPLPQSSPPPVSRGGSSEGSKSSYQGESIFSDVEPRVTRAPSLKFSNLSSQEAIFRATTIRVDKNGRRY